MKPKISFALIPIWKHAIRPNILSGRQPFLNLTINVLFLIDLVGN